jgi:hypothetical protein
MLNSNTGGGENNRAEHKTSSTRELSGSHTRALYRPWNTCPRRWCTRLNQLAELVNNAGIRRPVDPLFPVSSQ